MPSTTAQTVILATGGTMAGTADSAASHTAYRSAQLGVEALVAAVPALAAWPLRAVQLAQVDSKDMSHALWQQLVRAVAAELAREDVTGLVITHGTDTLEETAYFLQRVLAPAKPVVLTAAMRPATAFLADGPQNLLDAVTVARETGARGVLVVLAGQVHAAQAVQKLDAYRLDAFANLDAGPVARLEDGLVRLLRPWPLGEALGADVVELSLSAWPRVAWITSHAGFDSALVDAAVAAGFDGLVLAGTGNGSLHAELLLAAQRAQQAGVVLRLSTRCASGRVVGSPGGPVPGAVPVSQAGSAAQARVDLLLELLARPAATAR